MKTVTIPFDLDLAKKIQNGEVEGEIVDKRGINYEIVKWDASGSHSLICTNFNKQRNITTACTYTFEGKYVGKNKESDFDLQLVVPEYLTWKDGDYLTIENYGNSFIVIFKSYDQGSVTPICYHALLDIQGSNLYIDNCCSYQNHYITNVSTSSEIAKLTDALLKEGKEWNQETKRVEDVKKKLEHEFRPFDKVLVKDSDTDIWICDIFSHMDDDDTFYCVGGIWNYCIPYEGNEHLVGTTNNPEE